MVDTANKILQTADVGYGTNAYLPIQYLIDKKIKVDRIFLFSDMQCYDTYDGGNSLEDQLQLYRQTINPNVYFYVVD